MAFIQIPIPRALELEGDIMKNFKVFRAVWENYATAVELDKWEPKVIVAMLISTLGHDMFVKMQNLPLVETDRATAEALLAALEKHIKQR